MKESGSPRLHIYGRRAVGWQRSQEWTLEIIFNLFITVPTEECARDVIPRDENICTLNRSEESFALTTLFPIVTQSKTWGTAGQRMPI